MLKAVSILLLAALFLLTGEPTANAQAKACVHYDEGGLATTAFGVPEYEATWRELTTEAYTICYTPAESSRTINTIKAILDRANASIEARYTLKSVEPVIYILPDLRQAVDDYHIRVLSGEYSEMVVGGARPSLASNQSLNSKW